MFTSFHMPVKLSKYTTTHPNIKMQQKMLLQFSSSATFKLSNFENATKNGSSVFFILHYLYQQPSFVWLLLWLAYSLLLVEQ